MANSLIKNMKLSISFAKIMPFLKNNYSIDF